jgi:predicted anti-sigma-YlaC factor YlaD
MSKKITTNCARSLSLLSDYRDGVLDEEEKALVRHHLAECPPCLVVLQDVELIIMSAPMIGGEEGIAYPDESAIWQRMRITKTTVH